MQTSLDRKVKNLEAPKTQRIAAIKAVLEDMKRPESWDFNLDLSRRAPGMCFRADADSMKGDGSYYHLRSPNLSIQNLRLAYPELCSRDQKLAELVLVELYGLNYLESLRDEEFFQKYSMISSSQQSIYRRALHFGARGGCEFELVDRFLCELSELTKSFGVASILSNFAETGSVFRAMSYGRVSDVSLAEYLDRQMLNVGAKLKLFSNCDPRWLRLMAEVNEIQSCYGPARLEIAPGMGESKMGITLGLGVSYAQLWPDACRLCRDSFLESISRPDIHPDDVPTTDELSGYLDNLERKHSGCAFSYRIGFSLVDTAEGVVIDIHGLQLQVSPRFTLPSNVKEVEKSQVFRFLNGVHSQTGMHVKDILLVALKEWVIDRGLAGLRLQYGRDNLWLSSGQDRVNPDRNTDRLAEAHGFYEKMDRTGYFWRPDQQPSNGSLQLNGAVRNSLLPALTSLLEQFAWD